MKNIFRIFAVVAFVMLLATETVWAGNDDRRGTSGATELLINPWAQSAGWGGVGISNVRGLDAFYSNIAGLAFINKVEVAYTNTMLYGGKNGLSSGASINSFGLGVRVLESGVLGVSVTAMSFGDIPVTTTDSPEAGMNGTFSPSIMYINLAYSHSFTNSIHGGVNFKLITESTADASASGFAIDAGIQYVTGEEDQLKFGVSLKNIGSTMSYSGTGLAVTFPMNGNNFTGETRAAEMELPTCLNIGVSYDFLIPKWDQRITLAGAFTSNAFLKDNFTLGLEYSLLDIVQLRCGYVYQTDIFNSEKRTTTNTGLCAGASVAVPLSKKAKADDDRKSITIDYAFRSASPLRATHSIGASFRF